MANITRAAQKVGTLRANGKIYDLLQIIRAIWIIDPITDRSFGRKFLSREELLRQYPIARFK